ncbi:hypothetical protein PITC_023390 [Penicillium italicum]|uniref:Uncharacterized protein n=1 Tax=Penicillium italicum TaxID=40296 RepID=A0A0A2LLG3_PENIT|nr:hypothetical protein PITC_023390 [Penicillium italicum]
MRSFALIFFKFLSFYLFVFLSFYSFRGKSGKWEVGILCCLFPIFSSFGLKTEHTTEY